MSRFFTAQDSSSESSSSDEEDLYSEEEPDQKSEESSSEEEDNEDESDESSSDDEAEGRSGVSKFLRDQASSDGESSDSDTPKVVKSAKGKRLEELEGIIKLIDNAKKINDWSSISTGRFAHLKCLYELGNAN